MKKIVVASKLFMIIFTVMAVPLMFGAGSVPNAFAEFCDDPTGALPGGTQDPCEIPKYVTPLVIPPVMNDDGTDRKGNSYDIAVRQFQQQILPGGIWNTINGRSDDFSATTVWSYGPDADEPPDSSALGGGPGIAPAPNSQFNYPAYTVETRTNRAVDVRWINDLVDDDGDFLPHLLPIDQTLHWANPLMDCRMGPDRTDCSGNDPEFYTGPVPIVTHVHGAHVDPHSDGYPEAWWLPAATNIPGDYATEGTLFDDATGQLPSGSGFADYSYRQDQPATTLWYHDHTLGMTRTNVYAGPAGFWLIRGGRYDKVDNVWTRRKKWDGILPGPAPREGDTVLELNLPSERIRQRIREIPIVIQDRSFNEDGSLFYPDNRAFFEFLNVPGEPQQFPGEPELQIPFIGDPDHPESDIAPIWNPEAFFNVMVVNGVSWPSLDVAPALYRFRLLNGCNSRFLNLAIKIVDSPIKKLVGKELSFYQIGAEQGFLPKVAEIRTGFATPLPGNGRRPRASDRIPASHPDQALLMTLAERADVLVDFRFLPPGTVVQMINTAPDAPFGGFGDASAHPGTTGQVMQFVVDWKLFKFKDIFSTPPWALKLNAERKLGHASITRNVSLNEGESEELCVDIDPATGDVFFTGESPNFMMDPPCSVGDPFAPKEALLGTVTGEGADAFGNPLKWTDANDINNVEATVILENGNVIDVNVTENPTVGDTEAWNIYNFTEDAHPIHLHLVRFEVVSRTVNGDTSPFFEDDPMGGNIGDVRGPEPWETGYKDTVIAYPGEITTVKAKFDVEGLYVWHCHIVEHEDNEMMRPYVVSAALP